MKEIRSKERKVKITESFIEIRVCVKCGREQPVKSKSRDCVYCGGMITIKLVVRKTSYSSAKVKIMNSIKRQLIVLLENTTTWRCGKIERFIVEYLHSQTHRGNTKIPLSDIFRLFILKGGERKSFSHAVKRLKERRIIKVEFMKP